MSATAIQIIELVNGLTDAYPSHKLTEASIGEYITGLAGIDYEILKEATEQHKRTSQWFPKISELREIALRDQGDVTARLIAEGKRRGWCQRCHCAPCSCNWEPGKEVPHRNIEKLLSVEGEISSLTHKMRAK